MKWYHIQRHLCSFWTAFNRFWSQYCMQLFHKQNSQHTGIQIFNRRLHAISVVQAWRKWYWGQDSTAQHIHDCIYSACTKDAPLPLSDHLSCFCCKSTTSYIILTCCCCNNVQLHCGATRGVICSGHELVSLDNFIKSCQTWIVSWKCG